jgi:hypothetical protein
MFTSRHFSTSLNSILPFKTTNSASKGNQSSKFFIRICTVSFFLGFSLETILIKSGYYEQLKNARAKKLLKDVIQKN